MPAYERNEIGDAFPKGTDEALDVLKRKQWIFLSGDDQYTLVFDGLGHQMGVTRSAKIRHKPGRVMGNALTFEGLKCPDSATENSGTQPRITGEIEKPDLAAQGMTDNPERSAHVIASFEPRSSHGNVPRVDALQR